MTSEFADNQYMLHKFISDVITCAAGAVVARVAPEPSLPMTPEPELVLAVTEGGREDTPDSLVQFTSGIPHRK